MEICDGDMLTLMFLKLRTKKALNTLILLYVEVMEVLMGKTYCLVVGMNVYFIGDSVFLHDFKNNIYCLNVFAGIPYLKLVLF